ncbi:MAG TPA: RagB/SusD family nutrient uptake outer membrane protein [Cyclobacteriaceae bacterium]|nr:RagB/SusD family nutrient uptake outer membrane protein [Cyclobacteriaceae bacterium]
MKTIKFVSVLIILTGCHNFLEENQQGVFSSATFYKSESDALVAVTGVYNSAAFVNTMNQLWVFGDVASDDAVKGGLSGDLVDAQYIDQFNYVRTNSILANVWQYYYDGVTKANYVLYYVPAIAMDATLKNRLLGEAKFLRAYFYFNLVNIYGEIPLKLSPPLSPALINIPKSPVASIYTQIETDLTDASKVLAKTYSGGDVGRVTKGAAFGLLAKTRLYNQDWSGVLAAIDSLEASAAYSLMPVYKNNFLDSTQNNVESIFEIQHLSGQSPSLGSFLNQYFAPALYNGYYFNAPVQNFVDEFEVTSGGVVDPRLDYTVGRAGNKWMNGEPFDPTWSATGYLSRKHCQSKFDAPIIGNSGLDYVYMRYADILLMKAEALNETNQGAQAVVPLNLVRKRARESYLHDSGLPGYGTVPANLLPDVVYSDQSTLRTAIQHERRVELGLEFHRYFDLMRWGQAIAEAALGPTGFSWAKNRYFLIPQSELDTNPAITN